MKPFWKQFFSTTLGVAAGLALFLVVGFGFWFGWGVVAELRARAKAAQAAEFWLKVAPDSSIRAGTSTVAAAARPRHPSRAALTVRAARAGVVDGIMRSLPLGFTQLDAGPDTVLFQDVNRVTAVSAPRIAFVLAGSENHVRIAAEAYSVNWPGTPWETRTNATEPAMTETLRSFLQAIKTYAEATVIP